MKRPFRQAFNTEPVRQALAEYIGAWEALLDETEGDQLLINHQTSLELDIAARKRRHDELNHRLKMEEQGGGQEPNKGKIVVLKIAMEHAARDIALWSQAHHNIERNRDSALQRLQQEAKEVLPRLHAMEHRIFGKDGRLNREENGRFYGRKDTLDRYAALDLINELGEEFAIDEEKREDRFYQRATIPRQVLRAKAKFMLALQDAIFGIDIGQPGDGINPNHLDFLSRLGARQSDRERGADNSCIAPGGKYRHNPFIHSLHTVALLDKFFHAVHHAIENDQSLNGKRQEYLTRLSKMRAKALLTALVHDGGEIDGELSQGIEEAKRLKDDPVLAQQVTQAREALEGEVFENYLKRNIEYMHQMQGEVLTKEPLMADQKQAMYRLYTEAFELPEKTDTFLGRFFKVAERMQSQHDYIRFQRLPGCTRLCETFDWNKPYSVNYAYSKFYDAPIGKPHGPHALSKLAERGDAIDVTLQRMLLREMEPELLHVAKQGIDGYYADEPVRAYRLKEMAQRQAQSGRRAAL